MVTIKSKEEVEFIRTSSQLVSKTIAELASYIKPGVTTLFLDKIAEKFIRSHGGAVPSFKNYKGFPFSICSSINQAVVHGFPSSKVILKEHDVLSIDVGVYFNGFHGDSAYTFYLKGEDNPQPDIERLLKVTYQSLYAGIEAAIEGNRVGDIGYSIHTLCDAEHLGVVRELTGHGIGMNLHEAPNIPNYGKRSNGIKLKKGMTLAIEPMITLGTHKVKVEKDGWTIITKDNKIAAHFEHTIAITEESADILSSFDAIEQSILKSDYLYIIH